VKSIHATHSTDTALQKHTVYATRYTDTTRDQYTGPNNIQHEVLKEMIKIELVTVVETSLSEWTVNERMNEWSNLDEQIAVLTIHHVNSLVVILHTEVVTDRLNSQHLAHIIAVIDNFHNDLGKLPTGKSGHGKNRRKWIGLHLIVHKRFD
jgi:hypothetical protein